MEQFNPANIAGSFIQGRQSKLAEIADQHRMQLANNQEARAQKQFQMGVDEAAMRKAQGLNTLATQVLPTVIEQIKANPQQAEQIYAQANQSLAQQAKQLGYSDEEIAKSVNAPFPGVQALEQVLGRAQTIEQQIAARQNAEQMAAKQKAYTNQVEAGGRVMLANELGETKDMGAARPLMGRGGLGSFGSPKVFADEQRFVDTKTDQIYFRKADNAGGTHWEDQAGNKIDPYTVDVNSLKFIGDSFNQMDKVSGGVMQDAMEAAQVAGGEAQSAQLARNMIESGFDSGFGSTWQKNLVSVYGGQYASDAQFFEGVTNGVKISMQQQFKGAVSNAEQETANKTVAQLGATPEAAWKLSRFKEVMANRAQQVPQLMREYQQNNPGDRAMLGYEQYKNAVYDQENVWERLNAEWRQVNRGRESGRPTKVEPYRTGGIVGGYGQPAAKSVSEMTDDELLNELTGGK